MKIDFEFSTPYGKFTDALYLADDHSFTPDEIAAMQQERLANWLDAVENPPPSPSEIIEIDGAIYEKIEIDGQIMLKPVGA